MLDQISNDDITIGRLEGVRRQVKINFYRPPKRLTENSLVFDPELMKRWWADGYEYARTNNPECKCIEVGN
jgi:hypothetical protein